MHDAAPVEADAQKKTLHAAEQERPDVAAARQVWREAQPELNPQHLVFIDETWASTNMTRRYGRAPRGQRCLSSVQHGHWLTTTFLAAIRHDAICAPCVLDGPIDGDSFRTWVTQFLAPIGREPDNGGDDKIDAIDPNWKSLLWTDCQGE